MDETGLTQPELEKIKLEKILLELYGRSKLGEGDPKGMLAREYRELLPPMTDETYWDYVRSMTVSEKLDAVWELRKDAWRRTEEHLRSRHPNWSEKDVHAAVRELSLLGTTD